MHPFTEQLLREHNFIVRVTLVDQNTLLVDYAGKSQTSYVICQSKDDEVLLVGIGCYDGDVDEIVYTSSYLTRLYILCDIYSRCRELKLPYNIVKFFDKEVEVTNTLMSLLPLRMTDEDIDKEAALNGIIDKIYHNKRLLHAFDADSRKVGILRGLNILKGLLV
jgi:hypothetical protein